MGCGAPPAAPTTPAPRPTGTTQAAQAPTFTPQPVVIHLEGRSRMINVASLADAQAVQDLLRVMAEGFSASEGGA